MFTSNNLIKIIKLGVYAALLAPLIYIPQTIFGTVFGKMIYFQIIIELALPFFIYLIIFYKDLRPKIDLLTKLILLFFGIIFISSIFGVDFSQSFWGEMSRMRGIFTLLHLLAFYFYIITVFRTKSDRKQLLFFVLLVGFVMAIFGFFERLYPQINIDKTTVKSSAAHRVMSTTGNSIFFAGLLLFMFFLSVYCFFIEEKRYRFAFLPLAAFFALIMFYTGTRAALVGFIAGIFFAVIYLFFKAPKKKKAVILVGFLLVVTLLAGILGLSKIGIGESKFINFKRLTEFSLKDADGSIVGRLLLWKTSISPFKERWFLGWGIENFDYAFDKYYDPHFLINGVNETFSNRAHNFYVDFAVMTGILGLLAFLSIFIYSGVKLLKKNYFKKNNASLFGLLAGLGAYMFFSIDSPSVNIMLFFTFALLYLVFNEDTNHKSEIINHKLQNSRAGVFLIVCAIIFYGIYFYNLKPLYAGIDFIKFQYVDNFEESRRLADSFLNTPAYKNEFNLFFGNNAFLRSGDNSLELRDWKIDKAIEILEKNPQLENKFPQLFLLGNLYLRRGSIFEDKNDFIKALEFYDKSLSISPKRQSVMFQMGTTCLFLNENEKAIEILKKAVALDENIGQPHWRLGIAYLTAGEETLAYEEFKNSMDLEFFGTIESESTQVASLCEKLGDNICALKQIAKIYDSRRRANPQDIENIKMLINVYIELQEYAHAKEYILEAIKLDPSLKEEGEELIKMINVEKNKK